MAFYAGIAWQSPEGFAALGDILLLLFTTYGVYLVRPPDDRRLGGMFYRWVYCFVSFVIIAFLRSGLGGGERALFVLGALYFGVLGSLDSINAFERFGAFMRERAASRRRP